MTKIKPKKVKVQGKTKQKNISLSKEGLIDSVRHLTTDLASKFSKIYYKGETISDNQIENMYKTSALAKKYIDKTTADMLAKPREFAGDYNPEMLTRALLKEKRLGITKHLDNLLAYASLYGDSLLIAIPTSASLDMPLSAEEDVLCFRVLNKKEYMPSEALIEDITSPLFKTPEYYVINGQFNIHHTRCYRLKLGREGLVKNSFYGISDFTDKYDIIKLYDAVKICIGDLIQDSNVNVCFIPNLYEKIAAGLYSHISEIIDFVEMTKSSLNTVYLDAGTGESKASWEQKNANFAGLSEVLQQLKASVAGELDRPVSIMFGLSAAGFSSGKEDMESYYQTINSLQETRLRGAQEFIDSFILHKFITKDEIEFFYPSLRNENITEEATNLLNYANAYSALVNNEIISAEIARKELLGRGLFYATNTEDLEKLISYDDNEEY